MKTGRPITHPITVETAGVNAPVLSSRTFTTWGTFFRVDSVKEVLTALRKIRNVVNTFPIINTAVNMVSLSKSRRNLCKFLEGMWHIWPRWLAISAFTKDTNKSILHLCQGLLSHWFSCHRTDHTGYKER